MRRSRLRPLLCYLVCARLELEPLDVHILDSWVLASNSKEQAAGKLLRLARLRKRSDRMVGIPALNCLVNTPTRAAKTRRDRAH